MVIIFTLIEGLRFGRGVDYNVYVNVYDDIRMFNEYSSEESFVFNTYCWLLAKLNMPYQALIITCSFILAYCGFSFLRRFRETMTISVPLFIYLCYSAENLFRWYAGFSLILMGIIYYLDKRKRAYWICNILAIGIHPMLIPVILLIFYFLSIRKRILMNPWIAMIIYLIVLIMWDNSYMLQLTRPIQILLGDSSHYGGYTDNANEWLTGSNRDQFTFAISTHIKFFLFYAFYLLVGKAVVKKKTELIPYYNILLIGIITFPAFRFIELADRYNQLFVFFQCLIGSYCYKWGFQRKIKVKTISICLGILLLFWQWKIIIIDQNMNSNKWHTMYVWDANGMKSIPIQYFKE